MKGYVLLSYMFMGLRLKMVFHKNAISKNIDTCPFISTHSNKVNAFLQKISPKLNL
jgi:hypothetical protein